MPIQESELLKEDSLITPEVGPWTADKYHKFAYYSSLFATSMKRKWDCRVYIDIFAGSGKARRKDTKKILLGSPFLALNIDDPFDKYIFCESDEAKLNALERRISLHFTNRNCSFILGDSNDHTEDILNAVPHYSRSFKVLTFCLIDPYKASDIRFDTIRQLAEKIFVDFLILIPTYMDINRNFATYLKPGNISLDNYLGNTAWQTKWANERRKNKEFGLYIAECLCVQMKNLGFLYDSLEDLELVRMKTGQNLPLYHLAFFSRNPLGLKFWRTTRINTDNQRKLWG